MFLHFLNNLKYFPLFWILFKVANLACSMSTNEDGIKIVKIAAGHLETLCPQV